MNFRSFSLSVVRLSVASALLASFTAKAGTRYEKVVACNVNGQSLLIEKVVRDGDAGASTFQMVLQGSGIAGDHGYLRELEARSLDGLDRNHFRARNLFSFGDKFIVNLSREVTNGEGNFALRPSVRMEETGSFESQVRPVIRLGVYTSGPINGVLRVQFFRHEDRNFNVPSIYLGDYVFKNCQ
ncbi:MAG: hypothetical protein SGJ18_10470 [Pseudomonadota bacterium]|nr:hypothetical protein [Pseudomonadota bacterium]